VASGGRHLAGWPREASYPSQGETSVGTLLHSLPVGDATGRVYKATHVDAPS